ncbi:MAG: glycosyltransferase family 1 protein [Candidatus Margulisiibacteriota bacterium]
MFVIDCRSLQDASKFRGIGTVIRNIIEHIPNKQKYGLLIERGRGEIESYGIQVLEFSPPVAKQKYSEFLIEFLNQHRVKQIHFMAQYNIPDQFNFPYSVTVHDLFNQYLLTNKEKYRQTLAPLINKLKKAKLIIAISQYTKQAIQQELPSSKIQVIYNGFNSSISRDATLNLDLFKELSIKEPFILYMGNFEKRKNFIGALEGFIEFSKRHPDYVMVACTGHAPLFLPPKVLWILLKHRKKIKKLSFIKSTQLANLYKKATALLFPSYAEGFGLPILEAMSVDTPSVISNTTALPEVGKNAVVYVNPAEPLEIAAGLESIILDPKLQDEMRLKMPKVLESFDVKSKAAEYDCAFNLA